MDKTRAMMVNSVVAPGGETLEFGVRLSPPTLEDPTPDLERLMGAIEKERSVRVTGIFLEALRKLPAVLRESGWNVTVKLAQEWTAPGVEKSYKITDIASAG